MNFLIESLTDEKGSASSMRILVTFIILVQTIGWAWVCFKTTSMPTMDWAQALSMVGPLLAKAYQKGKETEA
jgi:hypothetical protein